MYKYRDNIKRGNREINRECTKLIKLDQDKLKYLHSLLKIRML